MNPYTNSQFRLGAEQDTRRLLEIYAPYIEKDVTSFEYVVPSLDQFPRRQADIQNRYPWLVAQVEDEIAGYAYASRHRERAAYQWSVEVAIYLDQKYHRQGIGRSLYQKLFEILKAQGFVNAYSGITLPNEASVGLHEALGFQKLGIYKHVGYKFGRWHDVGWWSLDLQSLPVEPSAPLEITSLNNLNLILNGMPSPIL